MIKLEQKRLNKLKQKNKNVDEEHNEKDKNGLIFSILLYFMLYYY